MPIFGSIYNRKKLNDIQTAVEGGSGGNPTGGTIEIATANYLAMVLQQWLSLTAGSASAARTNLLQCLIEPFRLYASTNFYANYITTTNAFNDYITALSAATGTYLDGYCSPAHLRLSCHFNGTGSIQSTIVSADSPVYNSNLGTVAKWNINYNSPASIQRATSRNWKSIASSSDGTKLVAVADDSGYIYTSTDSGASWTQRATAHDWRGVASSSDGTKLVACVNSGYIYTSTDSGASWTQRDSSRTWFSVASSSDGTKLVAVAYGGYIYTSTDSGASWTQRDSVRNWYSVASSSDGVKLVATTGDSYIYTSTDSGVSWTERATVHNWREVASSSDGTKLISCVAPGYIYVSIDSGVTWTQRDASRGWFGVTISSDGIKAAATVGSGYIYTSAGLFADVSYDTDNFKFGTASAVFNGGSYLRGLASSAEYLQLSNKDWHYRNFVRFSSAPNPMGLFTISGQQLEILATSTGLQVKYSTNGTEYITVNSTEFSWNTDVWYFISVRRTGNVLYFYVDNIAKGTIDLTGVTFFATTTNTFYVGCDNAQNNLFIGNMDELEVFVGESIEDSAPVAARSTAYVPNISWESSAQYINSDATSLEMLFFLDEVKFSSISVPIINTDIIISVSINNGITYYPLTLSKVGMMTVNTAIYRGTLSLTDKANTNQLKYKITGSNNKPVKYDGLVISWS